MQIPLEITFRNLGDHGWIESEIGLRVARLEQIFSNLTACRVCIDQQSENGNGIAAPVVRIVLSIPGRRDLVISSEPGALTDKRNDFDLKQALAASFRLAERQLVQVKERMKGRTKVHAHDSQNHFLGEVAELSPDQDFGFLLNKEGGLLYFHRNSLLAGDFDSLTRGTPVHYVEEIGDTGPRAIKVRTRAVD